MAWNNCVERNARKYISRDSSSLGPEEEEEEGDRVYDFVLLSRSVARIPVYVR
jgi:hypothetical protein